MAPAFQPPYSIPVPGAVQKEGETVPHRHFKFADKLVDHPENVYTLWDMYLHGYKLAGGKSWRWSIALKHTHTYSSVILLN